MDGLTPQARENRAEIARIRTKMLRGELAYEEARELAEPCIQRMNQHGAVIARQHGRKFKKLRFVALMR